MTEDRTRTGNERLATIETKLDDIRGDIKVFMTKHDELEKRVRMLEEFRGKVIGYLTAAAAGGGVLGGVAAKVAAVLGPP